MQACAHRAISCKLTTGRLAKPSGYASANRLALSSSARFSVITKANMMENIINSVSVAVKNSPLNGFKKAIAHAKAGDYDSANIKKQIDTYVSTSPVVVFAWTSCPYCKQAKGLLTDLGAKFTSVDLDTMDEGDAIRAELGNLTDRTSMPNIFIKGENVGGCNDGPGVMTLHRNGELVPMLQAAGAL